MQVCIAAIGLILAASVIGMWNEAVSIRDTVNHHTDALASLIKSMTTVEQNLGKVPSRDEMNDRINQLRSDIDIDNKLVQKGTKGAELIKP